jgi:glycerophosphoryl diester phosphodiesterase
MKPITALCLCLIFLAACRRSYNVDMPDTRWDLFEAATPVNSTATARLEGLYNCIAGAETFGNNAVLKWSYDANGTDTTFYASLFCRNEISYLILKARRTDSTVLLSGYWRKLEGTATGAVRLTVSAAGSRYLLGNGAFTADSLQLTGVYGNGTEVPGTPLSFKWIRPLRDGRNFEIVVHRGGGQTADLLPASENSVEIIPYAAPFGATGIEIDVRFTSDGVPVLYHDATLNERLIVKNGMIGPIENYTYAQLNALVRLVRNNERIPTLRDVLETVVRRTPLRFVWLDTKFHGPIEPIRAMQVEFMARAAALGKPLEILIGIPDGEVLSAFKALPDHRNIPSVCELDPEDAADINARVWAPRWTLGLQNDRVAAVQAQGRRVFVWTLDAQENIDLFIRNGRFNGILSDHPSAVAYSYYAQP